LKLLSILSRGRKGIRYIIVNHKKELVIGILVLMFFVAVATATVYHTMFAQSEIGVTPQ